MAWIASRAVDPRHHAVSATPGTTIEPKTQRAVDGINAPPSAAAGGQCPKATQWRAEGAGLDRPVHGRRTIQLAVRGATKPSTMSPNNRQLCPRAVHLALPSTSCFGRSVFL